MPIPQDAEFFGIEFSAGTFLPDLPPEPAGGPDADLPQVSDRSFWLDGSAWEFPGPDNADVFVARLGRAGLLVHDPIVAEALHGEVAGLSTRSVERQVAQETGLTRGAIERIRRAERAVDLLLSGCSPSDVAPPHRLRRPVPPDPVAQALGRADTVADRRFGVGR